MEEKLSELIEIPKLQIPWWGFSAMVIILAIVAAKGSGHIRFLGMSFDFRKAMPPDPPSPNEYLSKRGTTQ